jgi:lipopolysaccharide transport system ATP-binding protein
MSSAPVVFDHVWKRFQRGKRHDSLRDLIPSAFRRLTQRQPQTDHVDSAEEFWALRDVSFEVPSGTAFGIIGPNGAGKSTTLKLLTKILRPTQGYRHVRGRIGALIEVAAGFHPDLTGRENIFLQGAVMGMRRAEISARMSEIIEFAGVSEFIDTQVKRYSSGMNARLGFSIAAHLEPDVLIIDEVLSVGDAAFQRRCIERMAQFRDQGTTIVFVSHDLQAITNLCHRALYLNRECRHIGPAPEVVGAYLRDSAPVQPTGGRSAITLTRGMLRDSEGRELSSVAPGAQVTIRVSCDVHEPCRDLTLGMIVYRSTDNLIVYEGNVTSDAIGFDGSTPGQQTLDFLFTANLIRGHYHVECYAYQTATHTYLSRLLPAAMFSIASDDVSWGIADLGLRARVVAQTAA